MALIQKAGPVGIDFEIDKLQSVLYNYLTGANIGWTNYESYPRAEINPKADGDIPEYYTGSGEYIEVLMNDAFTVTSFFLVGNTKVYNSGEGRLEANVSLIFQADISKLFPTVPHRADEEMHRDVFGGLDITAQKNKLTGLITGLSDVYSDLSIPSDYLDKSVKLHDMSNFHIFKMDFGAIQYNYCNI